MDKDLAVAFGVGDGDDAGMLLACEVAIGGEGVAIAGGAIVADAVKEGAIVGDVTVAAAVDEGTILGDVVVGDTVFTVDVIVVVAVPADAVVCGVLVGAVIVDDVAGFAAPAGRQRQNRGASRPPSNHHAGCASRLTRHGWASSLPPPFAGGVPTRQ